MLIITFYTNNRDRVMQARCCFTEPLKKKIMEITPLNKLRH